MKNIKTALTLTLLVTGLNLAAQEKVHHEEYGNTLNLGVGLGYYGYVGHTTPVIHADYEIAVSRYFTLAPFLAYYSYTDYNNWGDPQNPYRDYQYRETVIPMGVKASYYFDNLVGAAPSWDFYLAGSLGFALISTTWPDGYGGSTILKSGPSPLFLALHIGTEYHMTKKAGLFLDLSTGVSTFGLAVHF